MLVLSRKPGDGIIISGVIEVRVLEVRGGGAGATVRLGIRAPSDVAIYREEVFREIAEENQVAAQVSDPGKVFDLFARRNVPDRGLLEQEGN